MTNLKSKFTIYSPVIPTEYWSISKTGKVLEFNVTAHIEINPEQYRLGVIQIGQIIRIIQLFAQKKNADPQIQVFPNLAEDQLVATIYWPELLNREYFNLKKTQEIKYPPVSTIRSIAKEYRFTVHGPASQNRLLDNELLICTSSNQPFVWLKMGQFIEDLMATADSSSIENQEGILRVIEMEEHNVDLKLYPQIAVKVP